MNSGSDLIRPGLLSPEEHRKRYREQLAYLNRLLDRFLDRTLTSALPPCYIVLQADHGPDSLTFHYDPARTDRFERFGILLAVRPPAGSRIQLPQDLTPVNLFRAILTRDFGAELPPLPNRHYISDVRTPYRFLECPPRSLQP